MDAQIATAVREGDVLAGKYRVERFLGAGGMGVVVAAHHLQLNQKVAIKFLLPQTLDDAEPVGRFLREAQAAVRIKSEHVARVIDVGNLESGAPYMVMEYLDGSDLGVWLEQKGPLPVEQVVDFVLQACEAIAEAHGLGIVHRDLKPANLFCIRGADGALSVKVLDFGISKVAVSGTVGPGLDLTRTAAVIGSPFYMSPEQLRSARDVDARTDIWSVGVILFQLLTGKTPFHAEALPELAIKIANQQTPLVRTLRPDIPVVLEQVIGKCLEKERERRYSNVGELAKALAPLGPPRRARASAERVVRIIQNAGMSASSLDLLPASDHTVRADSLPTEAAWGHTAPPPRNIKQLLYVSVVGVVAVSGVAVFVWSQSQMSPAVESRAGSPQMAAATVAPSLPPWAPAGTQVLSGSALKVDASPVQAPSVVDNTVKAKTEMPRRPASATGIGRTLVLPSAPIVPPRPKPNCDSTYTVDESGNKHFKSECFQR